MTHASGKKPADKTKRELVEEMEALYKRVARLEKFEADSGLAHETLFQHELVTSAATEEMPDGVMLVDMSMPVMGGAILLRELAERDYTGAVILVSGADSDVLQIAQSVAEYRETHMLGYIEKPLEPDALQAMLEKLD